MKLPFNRDQSLVERSMLSGRILLAAALISFTAGSLFRTQFTHLREARADGNRVFELMIYHTLPGKVPALESIFRDSAPNCRLNTI